MVLNTDRLRNRHITETDLNRLTLETDRQRSIVTDGQKV
jgi:hypothetical protein